MDKSINLYKKCSNKCDKNNIYIDDWNNRRNKMNNDKNLFKNFKEVENKFLEKAKKSKIVNNHNKCIIKLCKKELINLIENYIIILEENTKYIKNKDFLQKKLEVIKDLKNVKNWSEKRINDELYRLAIKKTEMLYL